VTASSVNEQSVSVVKEDEEKDAELMIPDFFSGAKLKFGKDKNES